MSLDKQVFYFEEGTCDNDPISVVLSRNLDSPETIGEVEVTGATATGEKNAQVIQMPETAVPLVFKSDYLFSVQQYMNLLISIYIFELCALKYCNLTGGVDFTQGALRPLFQDNKGDVCVAIKEQEDVEGYECFHISLKPPETGFVGCKTTKAIGIISEGIFLMGVNIDL